MTVRKIVIASIAALVFLIGAIVVMANIQKVPAGNVGIKVYLLGGSKGVDVEEKSPGRHWVGFNEEMFLFPTFTQNYTWAKDCQEGDCTNEEVGFQTAERVIESESGTACLCGHCAECWFLIHLQRDELSGFGQDVRFDGKH